MDRFQQMETFVAVVETGHFVTAAQALALSRAAVSRTVAALEARLGARLLHRTTRRLSLTGEGEVFYNRCREILAELAAAEGEIGARGTEASGRVRINAPVSFGIHHLAPLWGPFRARYPQVELDVTLSDRLVDMVDEGYDLALRIGRLASSSLVGRQLASTRLRLCASPAYLAKHGRPEHPDALSQHAVIAYRYFTSGDDWTLEGPDGSVTVSTRPVMKSNNGDTCIAAAVAGEGMVLQPGFLLQPCLADGRLEEVLPDWHAPTLGIHAVYPSRHHLLPKVRVLIDFLAERLGEAGADW